MKGITFAIDSSRFARLDWLVTTASRVASDPRADYISPQLGLYPGSTDGRGRAKCDAEAGNKHCAAPVQTYRLRNQA